MKRTKLFLCIIGVLLVASTLNAGDIQYFQKNGSCLYVEVFENGNAAFPKVVAALQKSGWKSCSSAEVLDLKTDTWCKISIFGKFQVIGECYAPHPRHGISIKDSLIITDADYSKVPGMVTRLFAEHRKAKEFLSLQ